MSISGNAEPGTLSGQQVQQQPSIDFPSAIPIKKRKFPIIRPPSPSPEENPSSLEDNNSKNKQESSVQTEGLSLNDTRNTASPANSDVSKTSTLIVKKEEETPTNIELRQANVDILASKHQEAIPNVGLGPIVDLSDKMDMGARTTKVKPEIVSGRTEGTHELTLSTGLMNVELSLGRKEPVAPTLEHQNIEAICHKPDKSDPSLLSLALSEEKLVPNGNDYSTIHNVSSRVCSNRSNWDLNTTMDVWEGSTTSDAFAHRRVDIGGLSKTNNCHHEKSPLTTLGMVGLTLNKGKHVLGDHRRSDSSIASLQPKQHCKTDDSLGLRLAMPHRECDVSRQGSSLSDNLVPISVTPNLIMQQAQLSAMNANRTVKSEPVDENAKRDCSIGSCSSSNMGSSNISSVKREAVNNRNMEKLLQSSISPEKSAEHRSIKSEVIQENNQECRSQNAVQLPAFARVMQHQDSCASSSAQAVPLRPQNSFPSRLSAHSELTTSEDLQNKSEDSLHSKNLHDCSDISDEKTASTASKHVSQDDEQLRLCKVGNSNLIGTDKCKLPRVDEDTPEPCKYVGVPTNVEENTNVSAKMPEENSFRSDCESQENFAVDTSMDIEENRHDKEDEEYEDGEVREPLPHSAGEDSIIEGKKTESLELVECESQNLQPSVLLADENMNVPGFDGKNAVEENHDETHSNKNINCANSSCVPNSEDNSLQKLSDKVLDEGTDEMRSTSVASDKQLDLGRKDIRECSGKEASHDVPATECHGMGVDLGNEATGKISKENGSGENNSTLAKMEESLNCHDAAKESNNAGNKSRIINLSRAAVATSPSKTRSIPDRLLTSRSGKERYSDLDAEMQPRWNRDETYAGGSHKFAKDRVHDQSFRNSRPFGKGRISGRFGSIRSEWNSDHDFASETYGPSDYRAIRRKHASSISDVDLECNGYGVPQNDTALGNNRRKSMNDEFPSLRRTSLRRFSPGDRDGPVTRGMQMFRRIPRNMSPSRGTVEDGSDVMGLRHNDKFMRHLSDDIIDPLYSRQQSMYDDLDGQILRGNRNFSTLRRKGYPQIRSKSPVSSRTRSPGPWSSPRRRSPNGLPELSQQRSPAHYRMGRMRSPDRACFRDEIVTRRRGSPSYARHPSDLRDMDSGREHDHPRSANSNRRSPPPHARVFQKSARRADALDSREMGDDDEYNNGLLHSNKFHELRGDGSIDERRKFIERRGGPRLFRPSYGNDSDNFRFHLNDGPRPYRFCPDADPEFVERSNMREREFDARIKHQSLVVPRRIRNMEEQQDGNYRPAERVWHDDGFSDARGKRRRF